MSTIRRQITVEATPRAIWAALTTADGLKNWLADEASVIAAESGRFSVTTEGDDGSPVEETGRFHTFRPTAKLEIHFDRTSRGPWKGTTLQFTIAREGKETVVNLIHAGSPFEDEALRASVDDAWRQALVSLRDGLEGG